MEGLSGVADHYCAICAIRIILEFPDQIWMNEKRGRAIVSGQPFPRGLGWCEELTLSDAKTESIARRLGWCSRCLERTT